MLNCVLLQVESGISTEMMCSNGLGRVCYFFDSFFLECKISTLSISVSNKCTPFIT